MPTPTPTTPQALSLDDTDTLEMPCAQALLAAVVALMSAYANPAPDIRQDLATHRRLLARKVVSNLFFLREHPALAPPLRHVMGHALEHWSQLAQGLVGGAGSTGGAVTTGSPALH